VTEESLNQINLPTNGWYTFSFDILKTPTGYDVRRNSSPGVYQETVTQEITQPEKTPFIKLNLQWYEIIGLVVLLLAVIFFAVNAGEIAAKPHKKEPVWPESEEGPK
jgi:hypothetical protein